MTRVFQDEDDGSPTKEWIWSRDYTAHNRVAQVYYPSACSAYAESSPYAVTTRTDRRLWDEAMLAATVWFCRNQLGVRRIYYHAFENGNLFKRIERSHPPRSLYTTLPRRFCFKRTVEAPQMLRRCRHRGVRPALRSPHSCWHLLEL